MSSESRSRPSALRIPERSRFNHESAFFSKEARRSVSRPMGQCEGLTVMHSFSLLAYFDPGSGSLVLQAIVGGSAGMLVFCRYMLSNFAWRFRAHRSDEQSK